MRKIVERFAIILILELILMTTIGIPLLLLSEFILEKGLFFDSMYHTFNQAISVVIPS
jgi:hypothetical protein